MLDDARDFTRKREEAHRLTSTLVGRAFPSVLLTGFLGEPVGVGDLVAGSTVVLYVYPGCSESPDGGEDSLMLDAVQHRAYDAFENDLAAFDLLVAGVSSQSWQRQRESAAATRVHHMLLSDPTFLLAERLGLPTFEDRGLRWYRRLTMIIRHGLICKVFYPVRTPGADPDRVLGWAKAQAP